jgi:hypothetical protein
MTNVPVKMATTRVADSKIRGRALLEVRLTKLVEAYSLCFGMIPVFEFVSALLFYSRKPILTRVILRLDRFPRSSIPSDITSQAPDPTKWGKPTAAFTTNTCDTNKYFSQHSMIFDITLCGDWAGSAFGGSGCGGSCSAAVKDPKNFQGESIFFSSLRIGVEEWLD